MTAAGREQERDQTRFVYVTRFGSHQCGAVLQLGGRRAQGLCRPGLGAGRSREEPRAAVPGAAGGGELCPGSPPRVPAASSPARASSSRSRPRQEAHAAFLPGVRVSGRSASQLAASLSASGLTQRNLAKKFDFPIPLNEASKIMKKKKKIQITQNESSCHLLVRIHLDNNEKV
ncbi:hypothetical protein EI555_017643 [Monodon monoceros]|uniref:Uncharacterized protein n=1 Tax=Monodon monoceros TaxID=40151 RepID=A0A4U1FND7_MONMO|nr:hypothetical protein EI555_017643 [Monodon monoceros]